MFHGLTSDFFVDLQVHSVLGVVIQPRCGDFRISFGGISVKMAKYFVENYCKYKRSVSFMVLCVNLFTNAQCVWLRVVTSMFLALI